MQQHYTFSIDAPKCQSCPHYEDCSNKRMAMCAYIDPASQEATQPIMADIMVKHDYRDIKINENMTITIDLEEMKKKITEDFYRSIGCPFMEA